MNSFIEVLEEQDTEIVVSSLVKTNKDVAFLKYLNNEGRKALFFEVIKEYPIKRGKSWTMTTGALYSLAKSLGISKILLFLSEILNAPTVNINQRIKLAVDKGYIPSRNYDDKDYQQAKENYIKMYSV
jgi:3-polyprenyl-4-hydroxybenzoate decarboxylase